jgi:hypothetical protein
MFISKAPLQNILTINNQHPEWQPKKLDGAVHSLHANCDLV